MICPVLKPWYFPSGIPRSKQFRPGLTLQNATKYCPISKETMKGHMFQKRQNVRSTKHKHKNLIDLRPPKPMSIPTSNELHIQVQHISKFYTDDTGKFPVRSLSGNQYIMVAYHCDLNAILAVPFTSKQIKTGYR